MRSELIGTSPGKETPRISGEPMQGEVEPTATTLPQTPPQNQAPPAGQPAAVQRARYWPCRS